MKWAKPLGPRRSKGTNPRAKGTDQRTRLVQPRALPWPTNPRFQAAAYEAAKAAVGPVEPPAPARPHRPSRQLLQFPWVGCAGDSGWRRRAAAVSGPCADCDDTGWCAFEDGSTVSAAPCTVRITPDPLELGEEPDEPP